MSEADDAFGPVLAAKPDPDEVFGPTVARIERDIALAAFGPCVVFGRPAGYSDETADKILDAIMGGKTLEQIDKIEDLPSKSTILRWAARYPEFQHLLDEAIEWRTRLRCDEVIDIADNATGDYTLEDTGDEDSVPVMAFRKNNVVRAKLQIDTRFKAMAAENPRRFAINQPRAPEQPAPDAPRDPEDARDITPIARLIDLHPMTEQRAALTQPTPKPET